jgi:hypothetical protein
VDPDHLVLAGPDLLARTDGIDDKDPTDASASSTQSHRSHRNRRAATACIDERLLSSQAVLIVRSRPVSFGLSASGFDKQLRKGCASMRGQQKQSLRVYRRRSIVVFYDTGRRIVGHF